MVLLIGFLILLLFLVAVTAAGMVIVLRERMAVEERLNRYCREA